MKFILFYFIFLIVVFVKIMLIVVFMKSFKIVDDKYYNE